MDLLLQDFKLYSEFYYNQLLTDLHTSAAQQLQNDSGRPSSHHEQTEPREVDLETVSTISYIVNVYIDSVLCLFGFTGNFLILFILCRDKSQSSNKCFLQALAVYDILILCYTLLYTVLRSVYPATGQMIRYYNITPYIIALVLPTAWIVQTGTIWFTTIVAADRYLAITYPFKAAIMCSYKRAVKISIGVSIVAALFNLPRFGHYYLVAQNIARSNSSAGTFVAHIKVELPGWNENLYHYVYHITLTFIFLYIVPLTLLIIFNCRLIRALHKARKNQLRMLTAFTNQKAYRQNSAITLNMIIIIFKFILCQTPDFIAAIIGALPVKVASESYLIFLVFKELFLVINSTVNFYIYLIFNAKFRKILHESCCCCCCCVGKKKNGSHNKAATVTVSRSCKTSTSSTGNGVATN